MTVKGRSLFLSGGMNVVFDPDDPDTPIMVYLHKHRASATFFCALSTGEVEEVELTPAQCSDLEALENSAVDFEALVKGDA